MNEIFEYITKGFFLAGQLPLDAKTYFPTITQMQDLGSLNSKAFYYYDLMKVACSETGKYYIWKEVDQNYTDGVLEQNYQYPANVLSNGVDYSLKYYNFVEEVEPVASLVAKPFALFKNEFAGNTENYLEPEDVVIGFFGEYFCTLKYLQGAVNAETSWAVISKVKTTNINTPGNITS